MRPVCGDSLSRAGARLCVPGHGQPPRGDFTVKKRADLRALGQNWRKVTRHLRPLILAFLSSTLLLTAFVQWWHIELTDHTVSKTKRQNLKVLRYSVYYRRNQLTEQKYNCMSEWRYGSVVKRPQFGFQHSHPVGQSLR